MNKVLKSWLLTLLMFAVFLVVFFFGLRALLNALYDVKSNIKFNVKQPAAATSSAAPTTTTTAQQSLPLGDKEQSLDGSSKPAEEQKSSGIKWSYLTQDRLLTSKQTLGFAMLLAMFFAYKFKRSYDKSQALKDIKGEERWQTKHELRKNYTEIKPDGASAAAAVGTPVAHYHGTYFVRTDCAHNLIIGTTGSGKTQTHVLHSIKLIAESGDKQNFLINDPKGEILSDTCSILKDQGYKIVVLNLRDTENSSCWNPLTFVINEYSRCRTAGKDLSRVSEYVSTICDTLTQDTGADSKIWSESSKSLFSSLILMFIEISYEHDTKYAEDIANGTEEPMMPKVTPYSVYQLFSHFGGETAKRVIDPMIGSTITLNALEEVIRTLPFNSIASAAYTTSRFADGETRSSIFATAANDFSIFSTDRGIARLTSRSDIDFDALLADTEQPFCIYMIIPDDRPSRHKIATMFINQAYLSVMEYLGRNNIKTLPRRLNVMLDEFANLPKVVGMDNKITVSRSRNVQWWLYIQDLAQLEAVYKDQAKTIRENCANLIYIYSGNPDTNEFISKMLGAETREYKTSSGKASEEQSQSQQLDSKPLRSANQLRRLKYGETIVIPHRQYPIFSKFTFYYKLDIAKTSIEDVFVNDPLFTADTNLMPLSIFASMLPPEFGEFQNRIQDDENRNSASDEGGRAIESPESNPMEDPEYVGNSPESEAAYNQLMTKFIGIEREIVKSDAQLIAEINEVSNGEFAALAEAGDLRRLGILIRRMQSRNQLSQEQSLFADGYLKRLEGKQDQGEGQVKTPHY